MYESLWLLTIQTHVIRILVATSNNDRIRRFLSAQCNKIVCKSLILGIVSCDQKVRITIQKQSENPKCQ